MLVRVQALDVLPQALTRQLNLMKMFWYPIGAIPSTCKYLLGGVTALSDIQFQHVDPAVPTTFPSLHMTRSKVCKLISA